MAYANVPRPPYLSRRDADAREVFLFLPLILLFERVYHFTERAVFVSEFLECVQLSRRNSQSVNGRVFSFAALLLLNIERKQ